MTRLPIQEFAGTDEGRAFYRAYDHVLAKWPSDTRSQDIESNYGTTRVNICGTEGAPPALLLAGGGATSTVWFANVASLSTRYKVYAIDVMGDVGRSLSTGQPISNVADLLDWLHATVTALDVGTPTFVGHSYGAMIALAYALNRPETVEELVLLDPNSCFSGMRPHYIGRALPLLLRPSEKRQRTFIEWETEGAPLDQDWLSLLALGAAHFPNSKTVIPKRPRAEQLAASTVDISVVLAGRSKVHHSATVAARVREILPSATVSVLDTATHHTLPLSPAAELNAALVGSAG